MRRRAGAVQQHYGGDIQVQRRYNLSRAGGAIFTTVRNLPCQA